MTARFDSLEIGFVRLAVALAAVLALGLTATAEDSKSAALNPGQTATIAWQSDDQITSIGPLYRLESSRMTH
ncbi:MAG: hypothetical protein ACPHCI_08160 [Solirubrobacterales bacterium]